MPKPGYAGRKEIASEESKQRNKDYEREFKEKLNLPTIEEDRNAILQQNNRRKIIGGKNGNNIKNPPDPKEIDIYEVSAPNQNYPEDRPKAPMWEAPRVDPSRINMDALRELYRQTKLELQQERQANQGPQLGH